MSQFPNLNDDFTKRIIKALTLTLTGLAIILYLTH